MTNTHVFETVLNPIEEAVERPFADAIASVRSTVETFASRAIDGFHHRRMMKHFERLSDHDLQDVGFERDWDGSILPINR